MWRRGRDSNPRTFRSTVFKTAAINRSATSPRSKSIPATGRLAPLNDQWHVSDQRRVDESLAMRQMSGHDLYRCDLCHRSVDADTRDRARQSWQPLIICESCVREADVKWMAAQRNYAAAPAS
jgi:hypothetical protein